MGIPFWQWGTPYWDIFCWSIELGRHRRAAGSPRQACSSGHGARLSSLFTLLERESWFWSAAMLFMPS